LLPQDVIVGHNDEEKQKMRLIEKRNVQTMLSKGFDISVIAKCLSLTEAQVKSYVEAMPINKY